MFIGQYEHTLEEKGRLSIPKKFRAELADVGILTKGLDGCLFLFPKAKWQELSEKISKIPLTKSDGRSFSRLLTYGAYEAEIDRLGRILVPEYLRVYAELKKTVVVAGSLDRLEIWDKEKFAKYSLRIEKNSDEIAERLTELGI